MKRLIAAALLAAAPAAAFDIDRMSDAERAAFGQAVRDYLMENPQVLVDSINVLEQRRAEQETQDDTALVAQHAEAIFSDGHSYVGGNPDGDLTMVEFLDYRCGVCRQYNQQVHDVVEEDGNIRLIVKEFPILGPDSDASARFAVAVRQVAGDAAYLQAHEALIAQRGPASPEALTGIAEAIGVDAPAVMALMPADAVSRVLDANRALAESMAIMGTPTFIIGDRMLRGVPQAGLDAAVAEIRDTQG